MRYFYILTIILLGIVWLRPCVAATIGLSSTYQPSLQVVIDKSAVNSAVVLRAHYAYGHKQRDRIYRCNQGVCLFRANHHKYESDWTYFIEQLKNKLPDNATTPKHRLKFYTDNKAKITLSVDATAQIKTIDFSRQTQTIDYYLRINSQDKTATIKKNDRGEFDPLHQTTSSGMWGFSDTTVKLFGAGLAILITYIGFRYIPVSAHHH